MTDSVAERYLRLGLRLDRHEEGTVDAYFGPPGLAHAVRAEPLADPAALVADADRLLADLDDGWLRDQVVGLRAFAGVLAGERLSYSDEVEAYYGIRPAFTDEELFAAAHADLEDLLPGSGTVTERYTRRDDSMLLPADRIEATMAAVIAEARRQTARLVDLPDGEATALELVSDVPWMGYNYYLGGLRGRIAANIDHPMTPWGLLVLALHETYPGHQAERACKEQRLVRDLGLAEESIVLAPTPQSVISEGLGCLAPFVLLDSDGGASFAEIIAEHTGVTFDLAEALAIGRAGEQCRWADVNAALMLYERGASDDEAVEYLMRWGLVDADKAAHVVRFVREPTSRTYIANYPTGLALCGAFVARQEDGLRRLLTEQVRVGDLR